MQHVKIQLGFQIFLFPPRMNLKLQCCTHMLPCQYIFFVIHSSVCRTILYLGHIFLEVKEEGVGILFLLPLMDHSLNMYASAGIMATLGGGGRRSVLVGYHLDKWWPQVASERPVIQSAQ